MSKARTSRSNIVRPKERCRHSQAWRPSWSAQSRSHCRVRNAGRRRGQARHRDRADRHGARRRSARGPAWSRALPGPAAMSQVCPPRPRSWPAKSLELIREMLPAVAPDCRFGRSEQSLQQAVSEAHRFPSRAIGVEILVVNVHSARGIRSAHSRHDRAIAPKRLVGAADAAAPTDRDRTGAAISPAVRCPEIAQFADGGGLMSYAASLADLIGNAASLRGSRFSRAPSPPICRSSNRPSSSW